MISHLKRDPQYVLCSIFSLVFFVSSLLLLYYSSTLLISCARLEWNLKWHQWSWIRTVVTIFNCGTLLVWYNSLISSFISFYPYDLTLFDFNLFFSIMDMCIALLILFKGLQDRFRHMMKMYYKGVYQFTTQIHVESLNYLTESAGACIVFDLTQVNSHEGARIWFNNIQEKCPGLPCILLAHKADEYHGQQKQIDSAVSLFCPSPVPPLSLPSPSPLPPLSLPSLSPLSPSPSPPLSLSSCFLLHLDLILMQGYIAYFETSAKQGTSVSTAIKFLASHITKDDSMVLNKHISRTPVNARIDACTVSLYTSLPFLSSLSFISKLFFFIFIWLSKYSWFWGWDMVLLSSSGSFSNS